ncbi:hypothetical protein BDW02DRAFT_55981 [Decorospora gaudefroyi]|uniref:Uncharacterized protein n=1 Tax=Decorospora gaudefroyi TaxID=184978 RepID=A0A6A5KAG8_9PLEO|nr:hypothetical protein BDW02DRAFT_55981 [Decorospora gaudefroyi]
MHLEWQAHYCRYSTRSKVPSAKRISPKIRDFTATFLYYHLLSLKSRVNVTYKKHSKIATFYLLFFSTHCYSIIIAFIQIS